MGVVDNLKGMKIGKWDVIDRVHKHKDGTGGSFSVGYFVKEANSNSDKEYFMKVINIEGVLADSDNIMRDLLRLTTNFKFENDILEKCKRSKLNRIMVPVDSGETRVPFAMGPYNVVCYIVFEKALGDIRTMRANAQKIDIISSLTALQNAAVGIRQIHSQSIAHQDIKPSNVLQVVDKSHKLTDFGRAWASTLTAEHDGAGIPGDKSYAPVELWYGYVYGKEEMKRYGIDLYLLGQLILFYFFDIPVMGIYFNKLSDKGINFNSTDPITYEEILPFLQEAFQEIAEDFEKTVSVHSAELSIELKGLFIDLCNPNPELRGYCKAMAAKKYSDYLQRLISKFDLILKRYEASVN